MPRIYIYLKLFFSFFSFGFIGFAFLKLTQVPPELPALKLCAMVLGFVSGKATAMDRYCSTASSSPASIPTPGPGPASASASTAGAPIIYGRVDAENEDNLELINGIEEHGASERRAKVLRPSPSAQPGAQPQPHRDDAIMQGTATSSHHTSTAGRLPKVQIAELALSRLSYLYILGQTPRALHFSFFFLQCIHPQSHVQVQTTNATTLHRYRSQSSRALRSDRATRLESQAKTRPLHCSPSPRSSSIRYCRICPHTTSPLSRPHVAPCANMRCLTCCGSPLSSRMSLASMSQPQGHAQATESSTQPTTGCGSCPSTRSGSATAI